MENKIINALDNLTIDQTERLLNENMEIKISETEMRRIKNSVYKKVGSKRKKGLYISKKLVACAAAFAILITSMSIIGFDKVAAAIGNLFSFIPGYGIVQNNESIDYILAQPVSTENKDIKLLLNNAIATKSGITVMFTLERKNFDQSQMEKIKQEEWEQLQSSGSLIHPEVILYAGEHFVKDYAGSTGGGGKTDTSTFSYDLKSEYIGTDKSYKLEYADYGLSLAFTLKDYDSYHTLEEIGVTGYNNDISITAVPTFSDGKVQVDLYAINKSGYILNSFCKVDKPYQNKDLQLETNSGIKTYAVPDGYGGVNGRFMFDVKPDDKDFTLKIPYITVQSDEEKNIALKIPKDGEKVMANQKIEFKDCTMTIVDIEKTLSTHIGDYGELKMTIKYENKSNNMVMLHPNFNRTNIFGREVGGGWSADTDENGVYTTVYYALEKGESGKLRLKVYNPLYCITDEYSLSFSR